MFGGDRYDQKNSEYAYIGMVEYWIVDPLENEVTVSGLTQTIAETLIFG
ncbi:MAG: Uma2 family endonuclease [Nostoc sp. NOS(2021)]|nr:Uma2 family endonuclease [Nostoc sp. NOS(2021)]MBN3897208.1 Uma2 family endonuclease [Nostoc sp. NOS(2021)]